MKRITIFPLLLASVTCLPGATVSYYTDRAAFLSASTISLTDDFVTNAPNVFASSFSRSGVTYSALTSDIGIAAPGYTNFGAGVTLPTVEYIVTGNGNENFLASFATPHTAVGFDASLNGAGAASVSFREGNGGLLGSYTFNSAANDREFIGILSDTAIASFHWAGVGGEDLNTGFSNLAAGEANATAPEPGTVALLFAGFVVVAIRRRP